MGVSADTPCVLSVVNHRQITTKNADPASRVRIRIQGEKRTGWGFFPAIIFRPIIFRPIIGFPAGNTSVTWSAAAAGTQYG